MAELLISANLFEAGKMALENLENGARAKGITFTKHEQQTIDDRKNLADKGQANSTSSLDTHLK